MTKSSGCSLVELGIQAALAIVVLFASLWIEQNPREVLAFGCLFVFGVVGLLSLSILRSRLSLLHFFSSLLRPNEAPGFLQSSRGPALASCIVLDLILFHIIAIDGYAQFTSWLVVVPLLSLFSDNTFDCLLALVTIITQNLLLCQMTSEPESSPIGVPNGLCFSNTALFVAVTSLAILTQRTWSIKVRNMQRTIEGLQHTNEQLRNSLETKCSFMTTMTHELRTPMQGIVALSEELKESLQGTAVRSTITTISDCADHLLSLVDNILDFEKLETSHMILEHIPFSIVEELNKAISFVTASAGRKMIKLQHQTFVDHPVHLGDPIRFRQVILNLLSNAIKFTSEGGLVEVTMTSDNPNCTSEVTVVVKDTGVGIASEHIDHLFSNFSQADTSIYRKYGGSGLGLSICKKLCENMGGSIGCKSKLGEGSTFHFTIHLPVADKDSLVSDGPDCAISPSSPSSSLGLRVLLVDDNHVNQKVGARILSHLGCVTQAAYNGEECLNLLEEQGPFDVVIMDCNMPIMDGFQTTEEIRRQERDADHAKSIPILALTASATKEHSKRCMEAGMSGVLFKPLRKESLRAALRQWSTVEDSSVIQTQFCQSKRFG